MLYLSTMPSLAILVPVRGRIPTVDCTCPYSQSKYAVRLFNCKAF